MKWRAIFAAAFCSAAMHGLPNAWADDIAVFYAVDADLRAIKADAGASAFSIGGTKCQRVMIGQHRVVLAQMGVGSVETAITVASVLAKIPTDLAISIGPAGALGSNVEIGKPVIVRNVTGFQRGSWNGPSWGLAPEAQTEVPPAVLDFWQKKVGNAVSLASGEAFVASTSSRDRIRVDSSCEIIDMNSFGFARACLRSNVPFVILRIISDRADDQAGTDFKSFVASYDGSLGRMVRDAIVDLPTSQDSPAAHENIRNLLGQ